MHKQQSIAQNIDSKRNKNKCEQSTMQCQAHSFAKVILGARVLVPSADARVPRSWQLKTLFPEAWFPPGSVASMTNDGRCVPQQNGSGCGTNDQRRCERASIPAGFVLGRGHVDRGHGCEGGQQDDAVSVVVPPKSSTQGVDRTGLAQDVARPDSPGDFEDSPLPSPDCETRQPRPRS